MGSLFDGVTTRGRAFFAAGIAVCALGLLLGQRELVSLGGVLILLPLFSALAAGRARYRVQCQREITPVRVPAGQAATVTIQLDNATRLPTGLLLAEDTIPFTLGTRPRFVLDRIEAGGSRRISYRLQSDHRGRYPIGPLHVRVADAFGLVRLGRLAAAPGTLVVTPAITPLPWTTFGGTWLREGGTRAATAAAAGEDDVVPRAYRDGDELRRVHWRSTARYGELMVRREEQQWRNRAVLFLDTRGSAHDGRGPSSSFEYAVSAAASVGVQLAREGIAGEFVTDAGLVAAASGPFEDVLLDTLAVIRPSRGSTLSRPLTEGRRGSSGLLIAVLGRISPEEARQLASARHSAGSALALLLAVSSWSAHPGDRMPGETDAAASVLAAAGWRVATITADTPLATAWEMLNHPAGQPARPGSRAPAGMA
ncbi:MAG TPA: DUF58 domain-containing protein [Streptosporangiaceae bacterium]|nr:DUF58 domain-containing protein [Streptosporangiaceae bacterium]